MSKSEAFFVPLFGIQTKTLFSIEFCANRIKLPTLSLQSSVLKNTNEISNSSETKSATTGFKTEASEHQKSPISECISFACKCAKGDRHLGIAEDLKGWIKCVWGEPLN